MKKDNKKLKITIKGNEKNKSEIVYSNILSNMEGLDYNKDKQIEYLKSRINYLETNMKNKFLLIGIILINFIIVSLGIYFMYLNSYILGIILTLLGFILAVVLILKIKNKNIDYEINDDFEEIEALRKLLNTKLK